MGLFIDGYVVVYVSIRKDMGSNGEYGTSILSLRPIGFKNP